VPKIRFLKIQFANHLEPWELPAFRGAIIDKTLRQSVLFHNHTEEGYRYAYPLIQYKVNKKKAVVVCLNAGTDDIHYLLGLRDLRLRIGERTETFQIEDIHIKYHQVQAWDSRFSFSLRNWNAFNQDNYKAYQQLSEKEEDVRPLLKRILIGNIISFAKGIGWDVDRQIEVDIIEITKEVWIPYKGTNLLAISLDFSTNVSLPSWIGLGKGSSLGFGVVRQKKSTASVLKVSYEID
jgi:hypothetical protein